jgi:phage portal protein BeeE
VGLLDRVAAAQVARLGGRQSEQRFSVDQWLENYLLPANEFGYNNHVYPFGVNTSWSPDRTKEISTTLPGYMAALRSCPPAWAAQAFRAAVLSQARFTFRNRSWSNTPGRTFGSQALGILETPWTNGTTGELLTRMEWHAGLAGNAFVTNRSVKRLRVLRPDWTYIAYGSQQEPEDAAFALDGEVIGYGYCNGGIAAGRNRLETLLPREVAHWSPMPDPENAGIGMSWVTPAVREIQGDRAATNHKLKFFENGATPNMVVKGITAATRELFEEIVDSLESRHAGVRNAYRTLYLAAGADATVVGADLKQIDFKVTQGAGETRIASVGGIHPVLLGLSEGLQGSSLNAGNFGAARRITADRWIYPTLQDLAAALSPLVPAPRNPTTGRDDAELWFDTRDMPILREDARDAAEIQQIKQIAIRGYVDAGFEPASAVAAVDADDRSLLVHTGLYSVQLQPPGAKAAALPPGGTP